MVLDVVLQVVGMSDRRKLEPAGGRSRASQHADIRLPCGRPAQNDIALGPFDADEEGNLVSEMTTPMMTTSAKLTTPR